MSQGPEGYFGWLLSCCVSDEADGSEALSTALVFAAGMASSALTLYLAGLLHVL